jgi:hypothetical protein
MILTVGFADATCQLGCFFAGSSVGLLGGLLGLPI